MDKNNKNQKTINSTSALTSAELNVLWENATDPTAELLLILSYSGLRINELEHLKIDLESKHFVCDSPKTGKSRTIPIHSKIQPLVEVRLKRYDTFPTNAHEFKKNMRQLFDELNITYRDAHVGRSTFFELCRCSGMKNDCMNQLLGLNLSADPNCSLEILRKEIEKM